MSVVSPVVSKNKMIFFNAGGDLYAIDSKGEQIWIFTSYTDDYDIIVNQPIIGNDGTIYFYATSGLYAVNGDKKILGISLQIWPIIILSIILLIICTIYIKFRINKSSNQ